MAADVMKCTPGFVTICPAVLTLLEDRIMAMRKIRRLNARMSCQSVFFQRRHKLTRTHCCKYANLADNVKIIYLNPRRQNDMRNFKDMLERRQRCRLGVTLSDPSRQERSSRDSGAASGHKRKIYLTLI